MAQLSLSRSGYVPHRSRSALVASIAFNGGILALILALPATEYVARHPEVIHVRLIQEAKDPPVNKADHKPPKPLQQQIDRPVSHPIVLPQPRIDLGKAAKPLVLADSGPLAFPGNETIRPPVAPPIHQPVFVAARQDPRFAEAFHPPYPPAMRRAGLEGTVLVHIAIGADGRVTACRAIRATYPVFAEETCSQALHHWHFKPATRDGTPVQSEQTLSVAFVLNG